MHLTFTLVNAASHSFLMASRLTTTFSSFLHSQTVISLRLHAWERHIPCISFCVVENFPQYPAVDQAHACCPVSGRVCFPQKTNLQHDELHVISVQYLTNMLIHIPVNSKSASTPQNCDLFYVLVGSPSLKKICPPSSTTVATTL